MFTERRSVRRYKDKAIEDGKLNTVLNAARWAPSWGNTQCCELIVIKEGVIKKQLSEIISKKNPATLAVKNAPVVIVVCAALKKAGFYNDSPKTKFGDWFMYDLGLATQNICMAAHGEGLGTVIVGSFDHDRTKEMLEVPTATKWLLWFHWGILIINLLYRRESQWRSLFIQRSSASGKILLYNFYV